MSATPVWSILIPTHASGQAWRETCRDVVTHFQSRGLEFEILVLPNGEGPDHPQGVAQTLAQNPDWPDWPDWKDELKSWHVQIIPEPAIRGKGSALKAAVPLARGQWIATLDADLPYSLDHLDQAQLLLQKGAHWVTLNRRSPESTFELDLQFLPMAYGRHRLGLAFNSLVRLLFPIHTRDTQSGFKFFERSFARAAFARTTSPTFFYDVELFIFSIRNDYVHAEIPATLTLRSEKSTVRLLRDAVQACLQLSRIWWQNRKGHYQGKEQSLRATLTLKQKIHFLWGLGGSLKERIFLILRWALTPYAQMIPDLPLRGLIWDMGCGHGLLEWELVRQGRQVFAFDHDVARIETAKKNWKSRPLWNVWLQNDAVQFYLGHLPLLPQSTTDHTPPVGIVGIDVLHYFSPAEQKQILSQCWERLAPGGVLVVREVEPQSQGLVSALNRAYEKWSTRVGLTRSNRKTELYFRSQSEWTTFFESFGFAVQSRACSHPIFADILYICQKPSTTH